MTVIARLEVIPVRGGSMSPAIADALRALDRHPVTYRTTPTDTIIEAGTVDQVFAAVQAAHEAIPEERVITSVEIDEDRHRSRSMHERVASVERELGHPPRRDRPGTPGRSQPAPAVGRSPPAAVQSPPAAEQAPPAAEQSRPTRAAASEPGRAGRGSAPPGR
jgi:uncharacterized protein (TIGR00106 family)